MIALISLIIVDLSVVKIYDITNKYLIPIQTKILFFSINTMGCIILQFVILKYINNLFFYDKKIRRISINKFYRVTLLSTAISGILVTVIIYQLILYSSYNLILIYLFIIIGYGIASGMLAYLSILFISWYRQNKNVKILLFFISMLLITFNMIITATLTCLNLKDRPQMIKHFVGGSIHISGGKYYVLDIIHKVVSFLAFSFMWITTTIMITSYRNKLLTTIVYWLLLFIPFFYFLVNYLWKYIFGNILYTYLSADPIAASTLLIAILSLSKPIGALAFGIVFWKMAKIVQYERNLMLYMFISGWGIVLLFSTNQAMTQVFTPYPPFGIASISIIALSSYFMLVGIYNTAALVSVDQNLRRVIHTQASASNLMNLIGTAEMENEVQKTVNKILEDKNIIEKNTGRELEVDEDELKKYLDVIVKLKEKEATK